MASDFSVRSMVLVSILLMILTSFKVVSQSQFPIDLVVAKDGTGNFTRVSDAIAAAPKSNSKRFVIYIKSGVYQENVEVGQDKINIVFIGDGIDRTVITGNRSNGTGWGTSDSATVAILGRSFMARGMTFENSAGPGMGQAVALRSHSDTSAFYRCSFLGYQDTLYVKEKKQFYRECDIYGTIDFIFGDAAVVFQDCNIYLRRPLQGQGNVVTAQGRTSLDTPSGISIHNCTITAAPDLVPVKSMFRSYLGRPWKLYSRTVILQSFLDDIIDPAGWLEWNGGFALDTLFYAEYGNTGAGADTRNRVRWPGYKVITDPDEAMNFTVSSFIQGDQWILSTGIPFVSGLM